jgi:hypothetical protein
VLAGAQPLHLVAPALRGTTHEERVARAAESHWRVSDHVPLRVERDDSHRRRLPRDEGQARRLGDELRDRARRVDLAPAGRLLLRAERRQRGDRGQRQQTRDEYCPGRYVHERLPPGGLIYRCGPVKMQGGGWRVEGRERP